MIESLAVIASLAFVELLAAERAYNALHILQAEHYENARLRDWIKRRHERVPLKELGAALAIVAIAAILSTISVVAALVAGVLGVASAARILKRSLTGEQIRPLVFTVRVRRIAAITMVLALLPAIAIAVLVSGPIGFVVAGLFGASLIVAAPEIVAAANVLDGPLRAIDERRFVDSARARLEEVSPAVIGITGSYGKTSTKQAVAAVADLAGPSYATPASYNSYLGVIKAINEGLSSTHRHFICEMGAYRRGDIAALCDLTNPTIGIITAIGPAHLERFGTLDATEKAKGELAEALPTDGLLIANYDDPRCRSIAMRSPCPVWLYSVADDSQTELEARNMRISAARSEFDLCSRIPGTEGSWQVRSRLLGKHNVGNLLAAAAVGFRLGLDGSEIATRLGTLKPTKHRLSLINNKAAEIAVLDDSYNSNPAGAASALEVLGQFPAKRRVMLTPGMVELGSSEREANQEFGRRAAAVCDLVILAGVTRVDAIERGLLSAGFDRDNIHRCDDGPDAHKLVAEISQPGDVILFENDLPDLYTGQ